MSEIDDKYNVLGGFLGEPVNVERPTPNVWAATAIIKQARLTGITRFRRRLLLYTA